MKPCPYCNLRYEHGKIIAEKCDAVSSKDCIGNDFVCLCPSKMQGLKNTLFIYRED